MDATDKIYIDNLMDEAVTRAFDKIETYMRERYLSRSDVMNYLDYAGWGMGDYFAEWYDEGDF